MIILALNKAVVVVVVVFICSQLLLTSLSFVWFALVWLLFNILQNHIREKLLEKSMMLTIVVTKRTSK